MAVGHPCLGKAESVDPVGLACPVFPSRHHRHQGVARIATVAMAACLQSHLGVVLARAVARGCLGAPARWLQGKEEAEEEEGQLGLVAAVVTHLECQVGYLACQLHLHLAVALAACLECPGQTVVFL